MPKQQPVRLREAPGRLDPGAQVIDADYTEVGKRRRFFRHIWMALVALFWAAVIGFLIPPAWLLMQEIGAAFAPAP